MRPIRSAALLVVALLAVGLPATVAHADVACTTEALVTAIEDANTAGVDGSQQVIDLTAGCTYTLTEALPTIDAVMVINGNGATITRSTAEETADFAILTAPKPDLTIRQLTIENGAVEGHGAGIQADNTHHKTMRPDPDPARLVLDQVVLRGNVAGGQGGGVHASNGTVVTITDSLFVDNQALAGGGLTLAGTPATITGSSFVGNMAVDPAERPDPCQIETDLPSSIVGAGAALFGQDFEPSVSDLGPVDATVTNTTFSGNVGICGVVAVHLINTESLVSLVHSTVTASETTHGAVHLHAAPEIVGIDAKSTIVAGQVDGDDCNQAIPSLGHNLESGTTCEFTEETDLQDADADLQALTTPDGGTPVHPLGEGSDALDAAGDGPCAAEGVTTDQNGTARPQRDGCDIGAYELPPVGPTVDAAGPYTGQVGQKIPLNPDVDPGTGDVTTYLWTIDDADDDVAAAGMVAAAAATAEGCTLSDDSAVSPTITCDSAGDRSLTLTVTDEFGLTASDTALLTITGSAIQPADTTPETGGGTALLGLSLLGLVGLLGIRRRRA